MEVSIKKYSLLFVILLATPFFASSQRRFQFRKVERAHDEFVEADFEYIKDDPSKIGNIYLGLVPFVAEASVPNFNFSANAEFGFIIKNRLALYAQARYAYFDRANEIILHDNYYFSNDKVVGTSKTASRPLTELEALGNLIIFKKVVRKEEKVRAYREGNIQYRTKIVANQLRMFSLRFGHSWYESYFGTTMLSQTDYIPLQAISSNPTELANTNVVGGSMHTYKAYIGGISYISKTGLKIKFDRYGKRRMMHQIEFFMDFIYAYNMTMENMMVSKKGIYPNFVECNVQEPNLNIPYGFRIGIKEVNLGIAGWFSTLELGMRPGYVDYQHNLYVLLKIGFNLAAKL